MDFLGNLKDFRIRGRHEGSSNGERMCGDVLWRFVGRLVAILAVRRGVIAVLLCIPCEPDALDIQLQCGDVNRSSNAACGRGGTRAGDRLACTGTTTGDPLHWRRLDIRGRYYDVLFEGVVTR